jgi:hypothetical protein
MTECLRSTGLFVISVLHKDDFPGLGAVFNICIFVLIYGKLRMETGGV